MPFEFVFFVPWLVGLVLLWFSLFATRFFGGWLVYWLVCFRFGCSLLILI